VSCPHDRWSRRAFLGVLGVGLAAALTGRALTDAAATPTQAKPAAVPPPVAPLRAVEQPVVAPGPPPPPRVLNAGPPAAVQARQIVLSVDDGYCDSCVAGYVAFAQRTGTHLTFCPNGAYDHAWAPHAPVLRPLIEAGQIQMVNHTFNHADLTKVSAARIGEELERNEAWIKTTFATTARPYYRPPYGRHNPASDSAAARVGLDQVVLWNGSYGDSAALTPQVLMEQARRYLQPGTIMLGHANHPTVLGLFDEIMALIRERALTPVTLNEMFNTGRRPATPPNR
jgi:peptidoglycan/xylan/chitin deacetylase (PgdA/CDA1 family)